MAIPYRGTTQLGETYFITANCADKKGTLQSDRMASLLMEVIFHYRAAGNYLLHEFVIMPNHLHLLVTPTGAKLEKDMQLIKGGFSFRAKKELCFMFPIWQGSYHDHRVRDAEEYSGYKLYIHQNPVTAGLCAKPEDWPYSSASCSEALDDLPSGAKAPVKKSN